MRKARKTKNVFAHVSCFSVPPNDQADAKRLWNGLERFVNTDDSLDAYHNLSKAWSTFWPVAIEEAMHRSDPDFLDYSHGRSFAWRDDAHQLFIFYRNILRGLWARDPSTSTSGSSVNLLFGLEGPPDSLLKKCFPGRQPAVALTSFRPEWGAGFVSYFPYNDFQQAISLLFRESWRAKKCADCKIYFIAEKSAQLYCGTSCSNRAHQSSSLKWWREKGARRRAQKG
jgi:hypothetical protein